MSDEAKGRTAYIILAIIALCTLGPWLLPLYLTGFFFDAPGSENNRETWLWAIPIWIYPVVLLACTGVSWLFYRKKILTQAIALVCVPFAGIILYALAFIIDGIIHNHG